MKTKTRYIYFAAVLVALFSLLAILNIAVPKVSYFDSERREPEKFPEYKLEAVLDGSFMQKFETYATDAFPFREPFRSLKSYIQKYVLNIKDNNDIYIYNGHAIKIEYPLNEDSLANAKKQLEALYSKYLANAVANGSKVYLSIVPDKNYFAGEESGHIELDYEALISYIKEGMPYAEYIDIIPTLTLDDYYKTDTHWKQENITDVADKLLSGMGRPETGDSYKENILDHDFFGVYHGQAALPFPPETIKYLTSDIINSLKVYNGVTVDNKGNPVYEEMNVYDMLLAVGKDPYQMFLGGSKSLIKIENPGAASDRRLVLFRDSFGSSIAPLMVDSYSEIYIVDIRYIHPMVVDTFVNYENADILFLYSTSVLNYSYEFK